VTNGGSEGEEEAAAFRNAALLLELASQGMTDLNEGRIMPQHEALARVQARLRERPDIPTLSS